VESRQRVGGIHTNPGVENGTPFKFVGVAGDHRFIETDQMVADRDYCGLAQASSKGVERVPQGSPATLVVGIRPEERNDRVARVETAWARKREIAKQRQVTRL
jgi:hypothetical protein